MDDGKRRSGPRCPGPDCVMCSGEACALCGAGTRTREPDAPPCEHDVIDRHTEPSGAVHYDGRIWK